MAVTEDISMNVGKTSEKSKVGSPQHGMSLGVSFAMATAGTLAVFSLTQNFAGAIAIGVGATAAIYCIGRLLQLGRT